MTPISNNDIDAAFASLTASEIANVFAPTNTSVTEASLKSIALEMMQCAIDELSAKPNETNTVQILNTSMEQFRNHGEITSEGTFAYSDVPIDMNIGRNPPEFRLGGTPYAVFHKTLIEQVSENWNNELIRTVLYSIFLKEGIHVDQAIRLDNIKTNATRIGYEFEQAYAQFRQSLRAEGRDEIIELAKMFLAVSIHTEYSGFLEMAKFLSRRGINSQNCVEKATELERFSNDLAGFLYYNKYIKPDGEIEENNLKLEVAAGFMETISKLQRDSSRFAAICLLPQEDNGTINLRFVLDPKYYDPYNNLRG